MGEPRLLCSQEVNQRGSERIAVFLIIFLVIFVSTMAIAIASLIAAYMIGRWSANLVVRSKSA